MPTFDVVSSLWLDVLRTDGTGQTLSLRQLFRDSHRIARLAEPSPLTEVAVLRMLIALFSDGLRGIVGSEDKWAELVDGSRHGLPSDVVDAVLTPLVKQGDVLAEDHEAFFDGPTIRRIPGSDDSQALQPVSRCLPELPTGTNLAHFFHALDNESAVCVGCLLKSRAIDSAFARGGLGPSISRNLLSTIGGMEPRYVVPIGETLHQTLLLNLILGDASRPSWISIHTSRGGEPGPIARMTWRPRLMMPVVSSFTQVPCARCATVARPRFAQAVIADTYNHKESPFGSKADLEKWKALPGDAHLLPRDKSAVGLGSEPNEWPLRAVTQSLIGSTGTILDRLPDRARILGGTVTILVASSSGNQAKVDDAPNTTLRLPAALFHFSEDARRKVGGALARVFDRKHRERLQTLIPGAVPRLLSELAAADKPEGVVTAWLEKGGSTKPGEGDSIVPPHRGDEHQETPSSESGSLAKAAEKIVARLAALPASSLAALRRTGPGNNLNQAAKQEAFEAVWHGLSLPSGCRRHSLREALVAIAPIYASHLDRPQAEWRRHAFQTCLRQALKAQPIAPGAPMIGTQIGQLIASVIDATPTSRNVLLTRLLDALPANQAIDFVDLLLDVACWHDPARPTPARWRKLLEFKS